MVCVTIRRDFSFPSLTLGLAELSAPSMCVGHPQVSAPEAAPEHRSLLIVEEVQGGGCGWSSIEPTWVVALPSAGRGGASTGEEGLQWRVFPLGISQQRRSALWWSGFLHKHSSYRARPSPPAPQVVCSQPTAVLCLGLLSRPHISAPSLCPQQRTPSQAGWAGLGSVPCVQVSLCPAATDCCRVLFPQRMRLPFCPS